MKTLWLLVRRTAQEYSADNCSHMAAAISYYVLFSVIPLTIFTISIFGLVVRDEGLQEDVAEDIVDFLNVEAGDVIIAPNRKVIEQTYSEEVLAEIEAELEDINNNRERELERQQIVSALEQEQRVRIAGRFLRPSDLSLRSDNVVIDTIRGVSEVSGALTIVGLVGMAWSASAMFGAIRKSLNIAWDTDVHRPVVQQKLIDLGMVLGLGLLLGASVAGTGALRTLQTLSDEKLGPLSEGTGFVWSVLPLLLPAILSFTVFLLIYRVVPNAPTSVRNVWPGALLATVLFEALKNAFAFYLANFGNYDLAYGALGGVLLFLMWTYLTSNILLIGAELASEYPRVLRGDYGEAAAPQEERRSVEETVRRAVRGLFLRHRDEHEASEPGGDPEAKR